MWGSWCVTCRNSFQQTLTWHACSGYARKGTPWRVRPMCLLPLEADNSSGLTRVDPAKWGKGKNLFIDSPLCIEYQDDSTCILRSGESYHARELGDVSKQFPVQWVHLQLPGFFVFYKWKTMSHNRVWCTLSLSLVICFLHTFVYVGRFPKMETYTPNHQCLIIFMGFSSINM